MDIDHTLETSLRGLANYLFMIRDGRHQALLFKWGFRRDLRKSPEKLAQDSWRRLSAMLRYAYERSPHYRSQWDGLGFHPSGLRFGDSLAGLPLITKEVLEAHKDRMVSGDHRKEDLVLSHTGGSSGNPTSFFMDRTCQAVRVGRQLGILELCGQSAGDRVGLVWGAHQDLEGTEEQASPSLGRRLRKFASGKETFCCNRMDAEALSAYYRRLRSFRPTALYGYPRAMVELADFIEGRGLKPIRVESVICTAERLSDAHRQRLHETFGGEVFNLYCTREHGCIGFECRRHRGFHVDTGSVFLETVPAAGAAAAADPAAAAAGEIVVTDLRNRGMPMIRNRIGDRGRLCAARCPCGSPMPLLSELEGRVSDMIYRPDGAVVPGLLLVDTAMDVPEIRSLRVVQETLNDVDLHLVPAPGFNEEVQRAVVGGLRRLLGDEIRIRVELVPEIPRSTGSGKLQEVVSKVKPPATRE
ncbi:MAG: hypothetical protein AB1640_03435 [bacterium]